MLTRLKKQVQQLLTTKAKMLHNMGITPNQISLIGVFLGFLASIFYLAWQYNHLFLIIAPVLFLISGLCDALDGMIARLHDEATVFGGFLDSLLDRYVDALILIAIITSGLCDIFWGSAALVGSLLVSYVRAKAEAIEVKMETIGLVERAERIIILTVSSFIAFFWFDAYTVLNLSIVILAVLTNLTVLQRAVYLYNAVKQKEN